MQPVKDAWASTMQAKKNITRRDFYSQLNISTWLSQATGNFPLKLEGHIGERQYKTRPVLMLYGAILMIVVVVCMIKWTLGYADGNMIRNSSLDISIAILQTLRFPIIVVLFLSGIFGREKLRTSLFNLNVQDASLRELASQPDYAANTKRHYIRTGLFWLITCLLIGFDFSHRIVSANNKKSWLQWIALVYTITTLKINMYLFIDIVFILRERFEILNEKLTRMIDDIKNGTVEMIYEQHNFPRKLRKIATIHGALCEAASNINQAFSFNIVLGVIYVLSIMTCAAFHLIYYLNSTGPFSYTLIWGFIASIDVLHMIWVCSSAEHEAWLTGKIIHKLNVRGTDTPLLSKVIQEFSLQLQHEKLEFSGAGLFRLNPTLIRSIAGTMTTYLIVLIQFNGPQESAYSHSRNGSHVV